MNGIIYTRVSSDEQVEGMSLSFQREDCLRYASEKGISVLNAFEERGESAKFANRTELIKLLDYCRKHRRKVDALIIWKLDRLSRNQMDYYFIKRTLLNYGIAIHSATEPALEDTSSIAGRVFETFSALHAEIDNTMRRDRVIRGMEAKINAGIHPWKPPLGYRCAQNRLKGLKKTEPDEPDPECLPIIQRLYQTCLNHGICGNVDLAQLANEWRLRTRSGKKLYPQAIDQIMGNKFYAGILVNPWKNEDVEGKHVPAISPDEFCRVQWLRKGPRAHLAPKRRQVDHPDFPLRKTVLCGSCSGPLTGSWSRGNGGRYAYYHCANKRCDMYGKGIPKADLEAAFIEELTTITPRPEVLKLVQECVLDVAAEQLDIRRAADSKNKKKVEDLQCRLDAFIEMKLNGLLSDDEFLDRKERLKNEIAAAKASLSETPYSEEELGRVVDYAGLAVSNLHRQWFEVTAEERSGFEKAVFPEGIPYARGEGFGTARLGRLYEVIEQSQGSRSTLVHLVGENWNQIIDDLKRFYQLYRARPLGADASCDNREGRSWPAVWDC